MSAPNQELIGSNSLPDLAARIRAEHEATATAMKGAVEHAIAAGELLLQAKGQLKHGQWLPWLEQNCEISERSAQRYMRLAENREQIEAKSATVSDLTIRDAAKLLSGPGTLEVMGSSASPEWYTPPDIVRLANDVLGKIDLDPSWHPNSPVQAETTYTVADNGLSKDWTGRVYLNPPYGRVIDDWIEKLVTSHTAGNITEAIALVPARVDTEWFRRLDDYPRCFVNGRITFANASSPAPFPSAVVYLGPNVDQFHRVFGAVGGVFVKLSEAAS